MKKFPGGNYFNLPEQGWRTIMMRAVACRRRMLLPISAAVTPAGDFKIPERKPMRVDPRL
jgi:hypothetical protein